MTPARTSASGAGTTDQILHATCVAVDGRAVLLLGPSGSGKSALGLELISLGASLVADDRTRVTRTDDGLQASAPEAIAGMIEARHVGLLRLPYLATARVTLAIDMGRTEPERLPHLHTIDLLDQTVNLLYRPPRGHAAAAIYQCLMQRRIAP